MALPTLHRALYAYFSLYAPLQALIGNRLYPSIAPQETVFPYVTIQRLSVGSHYYLEGASATFETLVQVDCWANSALEAQHVADVIRQRLDGEALVWDDLEVDGVFVQDELDDAEPAEDGSERIYYRTILTLNCWHEREVPALVEE